MTGVSRTKRFIPLIAALTLFAGACATRGPARTETSAPPQHPEVTRPDVEIDTGMEDIAAGEEPPYPSPAEMQTRPYPTASNPAAESLVNKGVAQLQQNQIESAEWHFEEAIRIAPQYGPAYYWMAKAKAMSRDFEQAASFLNKASSLAPAGSVWQDRVESLRREISAGSTH